MNKMPHMWENLLSNYKFCYPKLASCLVKKVGGEPVKEKIQVCGAEYEMSGSNPCIFKIGDKYMINIRMVNYHLNYNGSYHFSVDDGKIATVNQIWNLDSESLERVGMPITLVPTNNSLRYVGIEDWKPYPYSNMGEEGKWPYLGTVQCPRTGNIAIGYGVFEPDMVYGMYDGDGIAKPGLNYKVVETRWNKGCEKNWVFYGGDCRVIYQWFPLTIGKIVNNPNEDKKVDMMYLEVLEEKPMPDFFRHIRGSTHGYEFEDEVWFLAHAVEYGTPREYYHFFVVFKKVWKNENSKNTETNTEECKKGEYSLKLDRWSNLFKFEGEKIEYALGLIVEEKRILVSYSKWDREPVIGVYDKFKVEMEMF